MGFFPEATLIKSVRMYTLRLDTQYIEGDNALVLDAKGCCFRYSSVHKNESKIYQIQFKIVCI